MTGAAWLGKCTELFEEQGARGIGNREDLAGDSTEAGAEGC